MRSAFLLMALLCLGYWRSHAQDGDPGVDDAVAFPSKLLNKIGAKTSRFNSQLSDQTEKYLKRMARREEKMRQKLYKIDSDAAKQLFASSAERYSVLERKMLADTGAPGQAANSLYLPYADSLQGSLAFLKNNPQLLYGRSSSQLEVAASQMQAMQAKMVDGEEAKNFLQQRKQQIRQYLVDHSNMQNVLGKDYSAMNQQVYYYGQQLQEDKDIWNHPDALEQKALAVLNKLPGFQDFMKKNSQLAGLFSVPGSYATGNLSGLQTKDQVAQLMQSQIATGGANGANAFQSNLQAGESQMDGYKHKLSQLGAGNGNMDLPDFKPNDQRTKTFLHRIEYGVNLQSSRNSYYFPTVADLGLSLGYRLGHSNVIGAGASYKVGLGSGIQHIALSNQGIGLRSFLEIKIKGTFSATGGYELNYTTPFTAYRELKNLNNWTRSGLIGIEKTVSMNNRVFKKTKLQVLWDFLSYQQVPKTQPILFRVAYNF